ncbi:SpoVR family protein [Effusibacillus pohliae]|uniref:SpoVR family protein n=1 Tax=Effusibacillus pohliae TaxID=232270 RepID=UPI00047834F8
MMESDERQLELEIGRITDVARRMGLDFFPMQYELCPAEVIYAIGAYGMPTRFSHWSFGKAFHRMKTQYDFNLNRIYELVINSDPCQAFLLEKNSLLQNKVIAAHVLAHSDFFKNNVYFSLTNRKMVESMAVTAEMIREMEFVHGREAVETCLDAVLSIKEHIDPWAVLRDGTQHGVPQQAGGLEAGSRKAAGAGEKSGQTGISDVSRQAGTREEKDVLLFIARHSDHLEEWQRDIIWRIREEMLYFWPQLETKIINEGWATFWHIRIMRELDLTESEAIEFAKMNAAVIQLSPTGINPYHLGLRMFEYLEQAYGLETLFEVRESQNDVSFIRNYLTPELVQQMDLYLFGRQADGYRITSKDCEQVRERLIQSRMNGGFPYIVVVDDDYRRNGELYLLHKYEGMELDPHYVRKTLPYVYALWGRPVHLETVMNNRNCRFSTDGQQVTEEWV